LSIFDVRTNSISEEVQKQSILCWVVSRRRATQFYPARPLGAARGITPGLKGRRRIWSSSDRGAGRLGTGWLRELQKSCGALSVARPLHQGTNLLGDRELRVTG